MLERKEETSAAARSPFLPAFHYPGYRLFWGAMVLLALGIWIASVAQMWLVQELTHSPFYLGLVNFFWSLPVLLFSVLGGVMADKVDRVKIVIVGRGAAAILTLALALLVTTDIVRAWHVLAFSFLSGLVMSFEIPARQAILPNLVRRRDLMNAIALFSSVWSGTSIIGPAIAGLLIKPLGIEGTLYLAAVVYLLSIAAFHKVKILEPALSRAEGSEEEEEEMPQQQDGVWRSLLEGLEYIKQNRMVGLLLIITMMVTMFGQSHMSLLPGFAADILQGDSSTYGYLLAAAGVGALAGTLVLAVMGDIKKKGGKLFLAGLLFGAALMALSLTRSFIPAAIALAIVGCMNMSFFALSSTAMQDLVADRVRGRVMSIYTLTFGTMSFGSLLMGLIGSLLGVPVALGAGGVLTLLSVAAVTLWEPKVRGLD